MQTLSQGIPNLKIYFFILLFYNGLSFSMLFVIPMAKRSPVWFLFPSLFFSKFAPIFHSVICFAIKLLTLLSNMFPQVKTKTAGFSTWRDALPSRSKELQLLMNGEHLVLSFVHKACLEACYLARKNRRTQIIDRNGTWLHRRAVACRFHSKSFLLKRFMWVLHGNSCVLLWHIN